MPDGHRIILNQFLSQLEGANINNILDCGSGKTSLGILSSRFDNKVIDAIVYPGDMRKINSIKSIGLNQDRYNIIECDICKEPVKTPYDLVVSHLLLGEATKFGNPFEELFLSLMTLCFKYLIVIDYLEDTNINYNLMEQYFEKNSYEIIDKVIVENKEPQDFTGFTGYHNIGYLLHQNKDYFYNPRGLYRNNKKTKS
jgi:hypothetical protein